MTLVGQFVTTVLQGFLMTILGWGVYKAGKNGFWVSGNPQTKEMAQLYLVGFLLLTGLGGDTIFSAIESVTIGLTDIQLLGLIIVASRFVVNEMVDNWRHDDKKSMTVHAVGFALFALPFLLN